MAINTIEAAVIFQTACDRQLIEGSTSGWMEANAGQVKYSGGASVKIPTITTDGLGNYDRNKGYPDGAVSLTYQTKTMTMDRGKQFLLDRIEVDESNFIANATAVMSEFQRTHIIPEVDAYRYSKIFELANASYGKTYTPAEGTIMSTLNKDITAIHDECGELDLVIIMPYTVADIFDHNEKIQKHINAADFKQGKLDMKVKTYDGIPIIRVPSARMKTAYDFNTGADNKFGFAPTADAKQINWIICPRSVPIAVSKTDNFKIFDPAVVQDADGWKIDYRKFHDLWIKDNQLKTIRVCSEA